MGMDEEPVWLNYSEAAKRVLPEFIGQTEHSALIAAMVHETPGCDGLETFTCDKFVDPEEVEMMRGICHDCPPCWISARNSRPRGSHQLACGRG